MMFVISKSFEFAAAHSVHSQRLKREWAGGDYPKCRRLPGPEVVSKKPAKELPKKEIKKEKLREKRRLRRPKRFWEPATLRRNRNSQPPLLPYGGAPSLPLRRA